MFEAPRSKLLGMFCPPAVLRSTVRYSVFFLVRSLTPQQATGIALAFAVQVKSPEFRTLGPDSGLIESLSTTSS